MKTILTGLALAALLFLGLCLAYVFKPIRIFPVAPKPTPLPKPVVPPKPCPGPI